MAGKRHYGTVDHIMHNKLSRLEVASRRSTSCFKIAPTQDLQAYQNFMTYSTSEAEGLGPSSPWSATTAYLQYAGNALSEHMHSRESTVKYQRSHNPLQLTDDSNNQVSVHQNPQVHSHHMSRPQACPTIAMPTPVYRSPSNFMDAAYNLRGLQSLGVCVATQPTCPPNMEWSSSARFAHSSSLYASGTKKHLSTPNAYPEVAGSQSSLSLGLQEQNPLYRHRADMSPAVDVSSKCSQKNAFKEAFHTQQNAQVFYTEGNVPLGRQRSSAFTTPSPQHNNKPSAYQGNLDRHVGQLYSKNAYGNSTNSIHQRSSPFSSSIELTGSPHSVRGSSVYPNQAQYMHSGYVSEKPRAQTSHIDGTLQANEGSFKVKPDTRKTITEIPVCSPQREKNLLLQSYHMNKDIWGMSNRMDNEMLFNSIPVNRTLQERTPHQEPYARQNTHSSFGQQSSSSVITPIASSHELFSGQRASSHSVSLDKSSLHNSIHSIEHPRVTGVQPVENTTKRHSSRTHTNLEYAQLADPSSSSVPGLGSQYHMNPRNEGSRRDASAILCPSSELPGSNRVDVYDPKSDPTSISDNVSIDKPKSPPMPVINDVFSLAPYRAYLEGNAPHPFPTHQEAEVGKLACTSGFLETPLPEDRRENEERISSNNKVVNASSMNVVKNQKGKDVQNGEEAASMHNANSDSVVLDLSLKKLPATGSLPCGRQNVSCHERDTLLTTAAEKCLDKAKNQIKGQEGYISSNTNRVFNLGQASNIIFESSLESCLPLSIDRLPSAQENRLSTENLFCQRQKGISHTSKAISWHHQEKYQSRATETQKNNLEESRVSLATKSLSNRQRDGDHSQNTEQLPSQHQKMPPSEMTECLPQLLQNCSSQHYKSKSHNFQDSYKSHSSRSLSHQPQDNNFSQVPENLPQPDLSRSTSQTLRTLPVRTKVKHPSHSEFSVFVNAVQTQTAIVPVILASPPTVYFTNTIALHTSQPPSIEGSAQAAKKILESRHSLSSPSGSENESNGFHSSKSFMFRKYKMKKYSSSEEETQRVSNDSTFQNVCNPPISDTVQSLPPSAPESSPALGESNVSLANVGEPLINSSGKKFSELHRSLQRAITNAVSRSPSNLLEDWLMKTKEDEKSKTPVKTKNSLRTSEQSSDLPDHDIWLTFDEVRLLLHKLLSQLETFMFTRHCPFPHVIRAGAIFIPIYLVKEGLFPELLAPAIDRVLQKHKVELRPTTLSEERLLRETKLKDCPSRMLKLLALKQLPDVYPDLLCLFCRLIIQQELDKNKERLGKEELKLPDCSKKEAQSASPRKAKSSLILKLRRVRKHSGIHIYKTQSPKTPQKDKVQKRPVCRKKPHSARQLFTYKKKRRRKRFPNLVGRRILHLFDDGEQDAWFPGRVLRVHRRSRKLRDTQFEVCYDGEPGTRYYLELLQDYEKGWLQLDG